MKKIIPILFTPILAVSFFSCNKSGVEVVTQDTSYQVDSKLIYVAIPDSFKFDPSNIIYLNNQTNLTLNGIYNGKTTSIKEGNKLTFKVKIKKAIDKDVVVRLKEDASLLSEYSGSKINYKSFAQSNYKVSEAKLSAGETETTISLNFENINDLKEAPGYILPLRLEIADPVNGLKVSSVFYSIFVKLNITIMRDNIDSSNEPIPGTLFNSTITFESDKTSGLSVMKDGKPTGNSWYPTNKNTYLILKLPQPELIKGIVINTLNNSYQLASMRVKVEELDGTYLMHGDFSITEKTTTVYVRFKEPVFTKSIRFEEMGSITGNAQPDITEINLIK